MSTTESTEISVGELLKDAPRNWGKWGPDDEVGSLNYLTPDLIVKAAGAIKSGKVFTLQVKMANPEGDPVWPGRSGAIRANVMDEGHYIAGKGPFFAGGAHYADDMCTMFLQGSTQYDALGHSPLYGYGRPDVARTVELALQAAPA